MWKPCAWVIVACLLALFAVPGRAEDEAEDEAFPRYRLERTAERGRAWIERWRGWDPTHGERPLSWDPEAEALLLRLDVPEGLDQVGVNVYAERSADGRLWLADACVGPLR
jgi:hypothetical protein